MSSRIEIELTSARPDGTWTWRSAGALKPRGVLDGALLYEGAKAGDVVRADADFEIDGITILAILPPKEKKRSEKEHLELIGRGEEGPTVTTSLASGRRGRADGVVSARRADNAGHDRGDRPHGERAGRGTPTTGERKPRGGVAERGDRPRRGARSAPRVGAVPPTDDTSAKVESSATPTRPKAKRLSPSTRHRNQVLDSLPPEQRPIAEQVLRGGIPAVRTAIHLEREKAAAEGRPAPNADGLLAMAEEMLPRLKAAEWHDRAEAAAKVADDVALRDLRSVVAGADVARDEESRQLAATLRETLERRVEAQRDEWLEEVRDNLTEGRLVRALRLSARPPDPGTRFPAEIATQLAEAAGQAMGPDTTADRWAALLDAVAASPVRRSVKPIGLPPEPGEALLQVARQQSGRIPSLAAMLGIPMPPPPGPPRPAPRPGRPRVGRPQPGGRRPTPPSESTSGAQDSPPLEAPDSKPAAPDLPQTPATEPAPAAPGSHH
ncbi:MAG TPA: hypothetical protein VLL25_18775 [Acidimicrobiales bacterium]|nr:hypothetical protein [Acidimicrobiales bacterium]